MQLVLVAHRRRTAFEIRHISRLVGDDQGPLELARILRIHPEIGRQFHRTPHTLGHVNKRPVRKHGAVQRGEEIIRLRHHGAEIFLHEFWIFMHGFRDRHENHAGLLQLLAECRCNRNGVEHGIDGHARFLPRFGGGLDSALHA